MRIIALDIGTKTIGVAVSDAMCWTAQPLKTIQRISESADLSELSKIINEYQAETVVYGLPKNKEGNVSALGKEFSDFAEKLRRPGVEVVPWNEIMTSRKAEAALLKGGISRRKRKKLINHVAASFILESYLRAHYKK